jgi:hypothetical protein
VIPAARQKALTEKATKTKHIKCFNSTVRQRVSRLGRDTFAFSKKPILGVRLAESGITHPAEVASMKPVSPAEVLRIPERRARTLIEEAKSLLLG